MSTHVAAKKGEIAEAVLMPGDPLRAKFIAENYLEDPVCYNEVRGMYGYTGLYMGRRVSVQGSGMGIPSFSIYATELIQSFGVKKLIRVGTCGSFQKELQIRDIAIAMGACTNSGINKRIFREMSFAPVADFDLLSAAWQAAQKKKIPVKVGNILSSDTFYEHDPDEWKLWASFGVLACEMETSALYTIAAKHRVQALAILTVSDSFVSRKQTTSEEREKTFTAMMEIALETAAS